MSDPPPCPLCHHSAPILLTRINGREYWRCPECRLAYLAPEQQPDADTEWQRYLLHNNSPEDEGYRSFLARLTIHLTPRLPYGAHGLDYGSGPGPTLSVMLVEQGFSMNIYDPYFAPEAADLERAYDFITCTETAEHFHHPAQEFRRLDALLRPGGWLGVMTEMLASDAHFADWWYHRDPTHVCFYRRATMEWIARRFGWSVLFPARNVTLFWKPEQ